MKTRLLRLGRTFFLASILAGAVALVGCDSGDVVADEELAGIYGFEQFTFEPTKNFTPDAVVLDTLDTERSTLEFFRRGQFNLRFRFTGAAAADAASGTYTISGDRVRLTIDRATTDVETILLPQEFQLRILEQGELLEGAISRSGVNLERFSRIYRDYNNENGVLRLRLQRQ